MNPDPRKDAIPIETFGGKEPPPGTLVRDGDRYIYHPKPPGSYRVSGKGHAHIMRIIAFSFPPDPLEVLMGCARCGKTESVRPNPRLEIIPAGFTASSWPKFLVAAADRKAYNSAQG